jgi:hypothetical protein
MFQWRLNEILQVNIIGLDTFQKNELNSHERSPSWQANSCLAVQDLAVYHTIYIAEENLKGHQVVYVTEERAAGILRRLFNRRESSWDITPFI